MSKIGSDHLARSAIVYVRQSSAFQVAQNLESQRRQYALVARAQELGWSEVEVIDDDLGRSGAGGRRPGFEKLLAAICEGRVGAVLSLEASRLARNGRDWHTLLEFCGLAGALIIDEDGVYDAASPNDRLLLGMKGTMSEMELSVFRQRSIEAIKQKARRGELFSTVAIGYVKAGGDRIEKDADRRVQEAVALVFRKFAELQTIRQVLVWCREEKILLPNLGVGSSTETNRLASSGLSDAPSHADQSGLCRRLRVRSSDRSCDHRRGTQARSQEHAARLAGLGDFDPRPP
jgi:DNA invertase Pin-like site-specific DNA recombinase